MKTNVIYFSFKTLGKNSFLFSSVLFLIYFGAAPIFKAPIIADDLYYLMLDLGKFAEAKNFSDYIGILADDISLSTGWHHIMPFSGVIGFLQHSFVYMSLSVYPNPLLVFGALRFFWHVFALVTLTIFLNRLLLDSNYRSFKNFYITFTLVSIGFITFSQVHSVWKESPILSFGFVGAGIAGLGFIYLTGVLSILQSQIIENKKIFVYTILGMIGILTYEMFAAVIATAISTYLIFYFKDFLNFKNFIVTKKSIPIVVPSAVFIITQLVRLSSPDKNNYSGTQLGELNLIFPNFVTGIYGSLPLTYLDLAVKQVGIVSPLNAATYRFIFSVTLLIATFLYFYHKENIFKPNNLVRIHHNKFLFTVVALWFFSTFTFMVSSKYQNELGIQIGRVYMFYIFGNLAVIGIFSKWILEMRSKARSGLFMIIILIGIYTNTYNSALVNYLDSYPPIKTYEIMFDELSKDEFENVDRCILKNDLLNSNLPAYYKEVLIPSFDALYSERYNRNFCTQN